MRDNSEDSLFESICDMSVSEMRYYEVQTRLDQRKVKIVVDLGCSEGLFLQRLSRSQKYTRLVGVDIDGALLSSVTKWNVQPELLQSNCKYNREEPLLMELYEGDILKPDMGLKRFLEEEEFSEHLTAITLIQVIEHLELGQVPQLSDVLFGWYRPPIVIITTPNTDFNYYFGREGAKKMRHWDHKFEWNRQQFDGYCREVKEKYGYVYELFGVGYPKGGSTERGGCSQGALFTRCDRVKQQEQFKLVLSLKYPFWRETLQNEVTFKVSSAIRKKSFHRGHYIEEDEFVGYPIDELLGERQKQLIARANVSTETIMEWLSECEELTVVPPYRVKYKVAFYERQLEEERERRMQEEKRVHGD